MEKLISFVIPVYNVEKYLEECIESILLQCTDECELILVNDGSTDKSGIICDLYEKREYNIRVIHQKNRGLSSARNEGVKIAVGKYIAFVDSDDRISCDCLHSILEWVKVNNSDICFMNAVKFYPNGKEISLGDEIDKKCVYRKTPLEVVKHIATRPKFPGSACTKLFRRQFLFENNVLFPSDRRVSEDLGYCLDAIMKADEFDAQDFFYYEYRQDREGSITNKMSYEKFVDLTLFVKEWVDKFTIDKQPVGIKEKYAMSNIAYEYCILCWNFSLLKKHEKKLAIKFLKEYQWVLRFGMSKKIKMIKFLCKCIGVVCTAEILNFYMKWR